MIVGLDGLGDLLRDDGVVARIAGRGTRTGGPRRFQPKSNGILGKRCKAENGLRNRKWLRAEWELNKVKVDNPHAPQRQSAGEPARQVPGVEDAAPIHLDPNVSSVASTCKPRRQCEAFFVSIQIYRPQTIELRDLAPYSVA